jgi:hypothetical protein
VNEEGDVTNTGELEVLEPTEIIQTTDLTPAEARRRTDDLKREAAHVVQEFGELFHRRVWLALGYESWDAYYATEFADVAVPKLPPAQRREAMSTMIEAGMPNTTIAVIFNVDAETVRRDRRQALATGSVTRDDSIVTTRGTTRSARNTRTGGRARAKPTGTGERTFTDTFDTATLALRDALGRVRDMLDDDRFDGYLPALRAAHHDEYDKMMEQLGDIYARLAGSEG